MVSRAQLLALGFSRRAIQHRLRTGRLHRFSRGVYTVGPPQGTDQQCWSAALLACGCTYEAALSHRSAAALWGIGKELRGRVDVSVRGRFDSKRSDLKVRSRPSLSAADVVRRDGIPVTSIVQTLVDLATELPDGPLERAVNEADKHDLIDPEALRKGLFRPIAAAAGVAVEETKAWVNDFEVDFYWPSLGLVVETDGLKYHRTPSAQARDRRRDQTHTAAGLTQLRFTHWQVAYEAAHVRTILGRTVARLR